MYFRLPPKLRQSLDNTGRHDIMVARIGAGPPPGLLAYAAETPVGWMQVGPRADVPQWNNPRRSSTPLADAPVDDPDVWAITCFFFARAARGLGLSHRMVAEGTAFARRNGARVLEASPMDAAKSAKSIGLFVGSTRVFEAAGFREVARAKPGRPLVRLDL
jgi:GNAT superfamily N-acetyltransferase